MVCFMICNVLRNRCLSTLFLGGYLFFIYIFLWRHQGSVRPLIPPLHGSQEDQANAQGFDNYAPRSAQSWMLPGSLISEQIRKWMFLLLLSIPKFAMVSGEPRNHWSDSAKIGGGTHTGSSKSGQVALKLPRPLLLQSPEPAENFFLKTLELILILGSPWCVGHNIGRSTG